MWLNIKCFHFHRNCSCCCKSLPVDVCIYKLSIVEFYIALPVLVSNIKGIYSACDVITVTVSNIQSHRHLWYTHAKWYNYIYLSSEKVRKRDTCVPSMANGQWFFHLSQQQQRFFKWKLPGSSMHTHNCFTNCHFQNILLYMVSTYTESFLHNCFGHLHVCDFSKTKI